MLKVVSISDLSIDLEQQLNEYMKSSNAFDMQSFVKYRRDIAFLLMLYSDIDKPQTVIRFFGIWDKSCMKIKERWTGHVKVKKFLNLVLREELEPIRNRRNELENDVLKLYNVLYNGSWLAREVASNTLSEVKIVY